jgi:hypothetical protein
VDKADKGFNSEKLKLGWLLPLLVEGPVAALCTLTGSLGKLLIFISWLTVVV